MLHLSAEALRRAAMQIARARAECEGGGFGWDDDADEDGSNRGGHDGSGRTIITNKSGVRGSNIGGGAAEAVKAALAAGASRRSLTRLHDRQRLRASCVWAKFCCEKVARVICRGWQPALASVRVRKLVQVVTML